MKADPPPPSRLAALVMEVAVRLFNTVCGAFVGIFFAGVVAELIWGRRALRRMPTDRREALVLGMSFLFGLAGLIWGKRLWKQLDRRSHGGWGV